MSASPAAPQVSVVLPTRNRAFCLGEAIASILAQTMEDWELLVVDDGSDDATGDVMRRYCAQDSRIRHVRQPHGGVARALNTGLRLVRGAYLYKQDDDDVARPDLLATCAAGLDARPDHWAANFKRNVYGGNHDSGWTFDSCAFGTPLFFRVSALRALKGWNESWVFWEDMHLQLCGSFHRDWPEWRCETPLYDYRVSRADNSGQRTDGRTMFCCRYMVDHNAHLAAWGVVFHPPESQTLREAAAMLFAAHRRHGILPSTKFAPWQHAAWKEMRRGNLEDDAHPSVGELVRNVRRFPWGDLWESELHLWRRLQLLRAPAHWRLRAVWSLARNYFANRLGHDQLRAKAAARRKAQRPWRP